VTTASATGTQRTRRVSVGRIGIRAGVQAACPLRAIRGGATFAAIFERRLEAPPGFEPGVEVLQTGSVITKLLSRLAFWSALIRVLPRVRRVLFPRRSQVHFSRKALIVDPPLDRLLIVLFSGCAQLLDREIARRFMGTDWEQLAEGLPELPGKTIAACAVDLLPIRSSQFSRGRWRRSSAFLPIFDGAVALGRRDQLCLLP
jgi:hypothetical protein